MDEETISTWIFQYNKEKGYDLPRALNDGLREFTWGLRQHTDKVKLNDRVYFWEAGTNAGIISSGTVSTKPGQYDSLEGEEEYTQDPDYISEAKVFVRVKIDKILENRHGKQQVLDNPILAQITIIKNPQNSIHRTSPLQASELDHVINHHDRVRQYLAIYPGEGGELWRKCRNDSFIVVGWGLTGDISNYGDDKSEFSKKLERKYSKDKIGYKANRLWEFYNLKEGDIVLAISGQEKLEAVGIVTKSGYEYRQEIPSITDKLDDYNHIVNVNWDTEYSGSYNNRTYLDTIVKLKETIFYEIMKEISTTKLNNEKLKPKDTFQEIYNKLKEKGLYYSPEIISNYLLALQSKRFVILTGISGTGKTKIAMEVAKAIGNEDTYKVIAVRPDWTDNRSLLGYYNPLTERYVSTSFLEFLLKAEGEDTPYFVILDEMNIARVEHYFSDFLSCLESEEEITLHNEPDNETMTTSEGSTIPQKLKIPDNLFITGTVNIDETTSMFSPKVLDRAFTFEMDEVNLDFDEDSYNKDSGFRLKNMPDNFKALIDLTGKQKREHWEKFGALLDGSLKTFLLGLNDILHPDNRHFAYRVANEIAIYVNLAAEQAGTDRKTLITALDFAVLQKVLPKFHGTQQELQTLLQDLLYYVNGKQNEHKSESSIESGANIQQESEETGEIRLERTTKKIKRMIDRLKNRGFTSYIE
ncbi:MAG: AAA family ATPase [Candidatus Electryonea clarkiae]|nr:AAA family ATPase [Candidatus Electryonea clarkiae]